MPRPFRVLPNGDVLVESADCRLFCDHCSHGLQKRSRLQALTGRLRSVAGGLGSRAGHLRLFADLVAGLPPTRPVCLMGWDVLEYEGVFDLLAIVRRLGRTARIVTPGLRLADPAFTARVAAFAPELTLTCLTRRPELYRLLVGHDRALPLVERAMRNLREAGLAFEVNFVATSGTIGELQDVASFLFAEIGLCRLSLLTLAPGPHHLRLDPRTADRFVRFESLNAEIERYTATYQDQGRALWLWRVPPCRLSPRIIESPAIRFIRREFDDPFAPVFRSSACSLCRFQDRCFFVSRYYQERYPEEDYDFRKVNRLIDCIRC